jgi:hypothetical protein
VFPFLAAAAALRPFLALPFFISSQVGGTDLPPALALSLPFRDTDAPASDLKASSKKAAKKAKKQAKKSNKRSNLRA